MDDSLPPFVPLDSIPGILGQVTRADVITEARTWLDTPYVHGHRAKGHAVDCAGLVIGVARELGLVAANFDVEGYEREPDGHSLIAMCDKFMTRVPLRDARPGHVMVFAFVKQPCHLGILGEYMHGGMSVIQAVGTTDGKGSVREWRLDPARRGWKPLQGYALPGVKD